MYYLLLLAGLLIGCAHTATPTNISSAELAPQGTLAPKPLYRDPVFDGAADPAIIYQPADNTWLMFYTNRRANVEGLKEATWVHGSPISLAKSSDGANWHYVDQVKFPADIPNTQQDATYWAPAVIAHQGTYHMYLTIVPGIFTDWNHPRTIVHLTSQDLTTWAYQSTLPLITNKVIDASVLQLPNGKWRLWYNNERDGKKTYYADSDDLYTWVDKGSAHLPNDRGEAPLAFFWHDHYWLINDLLGNKGLGVYKSRDALTWQRQTNNLLDIPGKGLDDQNGGHHPEVIVSGNRAFLYYFVHPGALTGGTADDQKRSSIQVVELQLVDGGLVANRDEPTFVKLLPPQ